MTPWKNKILRGSLFSLSTILFLISGIYWFSFFLIKNMPLKTSSCLIEGWEGPLEAEKSFSMLQSMKNPQLFIVGKKYDSSPVDPVEEPYFWRFQDGLLLLTNTSAFLSPDALASVPDKTSLPLSFEVTGSDVSGIYAHFTVVVNGEKEGTFFTTDFKGSYQLTKPVDTPLLSLGIYYDNDLATKEEGRYLIIHSFNVGDHRIVPTPENTRVTFVRSQQTTGYSSEAAQMATYFNDLGLEKDRISIIEYEPGTINQTLLGAKAFKEWSGDKTIHALNIFSSGYHSRRSWLTYKRMLEPDIEVGIVTFTTKTYMDHTFIGKKQKLFNLIDESVSYVGNWIYFTFADP